LAAPGREGAGPFEIDRAAAVKLALNNRLDLQVTLGKVYDAQRQVVLASDALGAELTLLGTAQLGEGRSIATARAEDARLHSDKGRYSALLTLDLPFERAAEGVAYRNSFITLEQSVRNVQRLENSIKLAVRNKLGDLLESRESLRIQAEAVNIARRRVKSTNMFLEAGRAEIRDLLEAQDALLSTQNGLTSAIVNYRIAELELQRDMGVLKVNEKGLWQEYLPEDKNNVQNE
jgi:outer membrane protein TolC